MSQTSHPLSPGGQNVNKVSCAIHLRFDIMASSLPEAYKERLLALNDQRITKDGVVVMKAQRSRSQEQNKAEGLQRLRELVLLVSVVPQVRRATKQTRGSQLRRIDSKVKRGQSKAMRGKVLD
ncbi:alternative ribosome rescue aminoacyl-tRNA hydrolase ArfB [soil metagenome]